MPGFYFAKGSRKEMEILSPQSFCVIMKGNNIQYHQRTSSQLTKVTTCATFQSHPWQHGKLPLYSIVHLAESLISYQENKKNKKEIQSVCGGLFLQ